MADTGVGTRDVGSQRERLRTPKHFTDLEVWRRSHELFLNVLKDFETVPANKRRTAGLLAGQVVRSIGSIGANIAEGFNANTTKEYLRYLEIARRSGAESENWYYKIRDARFVSEDVCRARLLELLEIQRMIRGLQQGLKKRPKKG